MKVKGWEPSKTSEATSGQILVASGVRWRVDTIVRSNKGLDGLLF